MNLFKEIVNESLLLNELKSNRDDDIKKAINNVLRVRISYDDKKDKVISKAKGKRERYILPVAYGITKNGKRAIRAYQTAGSTKRGVPKWKLFLLDNIYSWSNGKKSFKEYGNALIRLGLNTSGDKHMTTLFAMTPIGNKNVPVAKDSNPIDTAPITKVDVEPTTQQVQNPQIVQKNNNFVPSIEKTNTSIDNNTNNSYFKNKVEAPTTEPIKKIDVQPHNMTQVDNEPNTTEPTNIQAQNNVSQTDIEPKLTTEPITKNDVEGQTINKDNMLTNSFKDMMNRMNSLNNDNEEEEK